MKKQNNLRENPKLNALIKYRFTLYYGLTGLILLPLFFLAIFFVFRSPGSPDSEFKVFAPAVIAFDRNPVYLFVHLLTAVTLLIFGNLYDRKKNRLYLILGPVISLLIIGLFFIYALKFPFS